MTFVSIVIPAWNEERTLKATLESLLEIDYNRRRCEVIVVAGGDDNTYKIAESLSQTMKPFSRYIALHQQPAGKNAAIQQGIKEAANKIIVLLDADTIFSKDCLRNMIDPIEQDRCDLTIANPEPVSKNWISDYYMLTKSYFLDSITTFSGHSMAFRRNILESRLDYFFDRNIEVGVDYFLAKRFSEQGYRIMFAKDANVITHLPSSLKYFILCELRWLTALIKIDGVNCITLAYSAAVVGALISAIPFSKILFIYSVLLNTIYIARRAFIVFIASRSYKTNIQGLLGFIALSYTSHVLCLISYGKHFLGLSEKTHLYQGQRY